MKITESNITTDTTATVVREVMSGTRFGYPKPLTRRSIISTDSKNSIQTIADDWFSENEIWSLDFKCKTWAKVLRKVNKVFNSKLRDLYPQAESISYSRNAGCSCGCSPGHIAKFKTGVTFNSAIVEIETSESLNAEFKEWLLSLKEELALEILSHKKD